MNIVKEKMKYIMRLSKANQDIDKTSKHLFADNPFVNLHK